MRINKELGLPHSLWFWLKGLKLSSKMASMCLNRCHVALIQIHFISLSLSCMSATYHGSQCHSLLLVRTTIRTSQWQSLGLALIAREHEPKVYRLIALEHEPSPNAWGPAMAVKRISLSLIIAVSTSVIVTHLPTEVPQDEWVMQCKTLTLRCASLSPLMAIICWTTLWTTLQRSPIPVSFEISKNYYYLMSAVRMN